MNYLEVIALCYLENVTSKNWEINFPRNYDEISTKKFLHEENSHCTKSLVVDETLLNLWSTNSVLRRIQNKSNSLLFSAIDPSQCNHLEQCDDQQRDWDRVIIENLEQVISVTKTKDHLQDNENTTNYR